MITKRGVGNGISILIFASILSTAPAGDPRLDRTAARWRSSSSRSSRSRSSSRSSSCRRASAGSRSSTRKRMVGRRMTSGGSTYMPLRVNMAGVIPVIFAAARDGVPADDRPVLPADAGLRSTRTSRRRPVAYLLLEAFLIIDLHVLLHRGPVQPGRPGRQPAQVRRLHPGHPPGPPTAQYLDRVLTRLTLPGSLYLAASRSSRHLHPLRGLLAGDLARASAAPRC